VAESPGGRGSFAQQSFAHGETNHLPDAQPPGDWRVAFPPCHVGRPPRIQIKFCPLMLSECQAKLP